MERYIILNGRKIYYEFIQKSNIKNINMRVRHDGSVTVSAPASVSYDVIESFIEERANWLLSHIDSLSESKEELFLLEDGGYIPIFGELKTINLSRGSFIMCGVDCDNINIVLPDPTDTQMIARTISLLLQSLLTEMLDTLCREIYEDHFEILEIQYPDISLRRMSSRWGSCHVDKHKIVFNKALVFVPEKCIEYVVCHEFTHFLHPDHSIRFYATLERIFPEWRACKAELKKYQSIPDNLF